MQRNFILDINFENEKYYFWKSRLCRNTKFQSIDIDDKKIGMMQKFYGKY